MQVTELEQRVYTIAEELMSMCKTDPVLKQQSHAARLEQNPEWGLVLGLGYSTSQKTRLIYDHVHKMLSHMRDITGGDAAKAKELSEMLYFRTHAGPNT